MSEARNDALRGKLEYLFVNHDSVACITELRGLRKGLPIQQVAKLHNTSVKMIERHYAKYIATALEDLARAAVVSLVPRSDGNVGPMGKRA
jgi:hypothetical protein